MPDVLIDLDLVAPLPGSGDPEDRRPPFWRRWRASRLTRTQRRIAGATVLLVCAALLPVGAASPPPPRFGPKVLLGTALDQRIVLTDRGVVTSAGGGSEVRGYGFDGRLRWRSGVDWAGGIGLLAGYRVAGGVVLGSRRGVGALDSATGALRWRVDGVVLGVHPTTAVLATGGPFSVGTQNAIITGVDTADGSRRWRIEIGPTDRQLVEVISADPATMGAVGAVAVVGEDGAATYIDAPTGARRRLADWPVVREEYFHNTALGIGGIVVALNRRLDGTGAIHGYGPNDGPNSEQPLWKRPYLGTDIAPCGALLCLPEGGGVRTVNPRTGADGAWYDVPAVLGGWGDRIIGYRPVGVNSPSRVVVFDTGTGRVVRTLNGWQVLGNMRPGPWVPIVRQITEIRWQVATLRLADGQAFLLGGLGSGGAQPPCQIDAVRLACGTIDGEIPVWRYVPA